MTDQSSSASSSASTIEKRTGKNSGNVEDITLGMSALEIKEEKQRAEDAVAVSQDDETIAVANNSEDLLAEEEQRMANILVAFAVISNVLIAKFDWHLRKSLMLVCRGFLSIYRRIPIMVDISKKWSQTGVGSERYDLYMKSLCWYESLTFDDKYGTEVLEKHLEQAAILKKFRLVASRESTFHMALKMLHGEVHVMLDLTKCRIDIADKIYRNVERLELRYGNIFTPVGKSTMAPATASTICADGKLLPIGALNQPPSINDTVTWQLKAICFHENVSLLDLYVPFRLLLPQLDTIYDRTDALGIMGWEISESGEGGVYERCINLYSALTSRLQSIKRYMVGQVTFVDERDCKLELIPQMSELRELSLDFESVEYRSDYQPHIIRLPEKLESFSLSYDSISEHAMNIIKFCGLAQLKMLILPNVTSQSHLTLLLNSLDSDLQAQVEMLVICLRNLADDEEEAKLEGEEGEESGEKHVNIDIMLMSFFRALKHLCIFTGLPITLDAYLKWNDTHIEEGVEKTLLNQFLTGKHATEPSSPWEATSLIPCIQALPCSLESLVIIADKFSLSPSLEVWPSLDRVRLQGDGCGSADRLFHQRPNACITQEIVAQHRGNKLQSMPCIIAHSLANATTFQT